MNKLLLTMTAIPALAVAMPAAAQNTTGANANANANANTNAYPGLQNRIGQLQTRFEAGLQQGTITRSEAWPLRQRLNEVVALEARYRSDGISREERADLRQRIRTLHEQIRVADSGAYDRYDSYADRYDFDSAADYAGNDRIDNNRDGFDDRDVDRDGRWDDDVAAGRSRADAYAANDRIDSNRDGYDDRDVDRDGRWDDDVSAGRYQGTGGPEEIEGWVIDDGTQTRGGIQGLFDTVLGAGGLRAGMRAPTNLYAVPYEYRSQFRDNASVYYRSDGTRVYEIDARTQTVVRVFRRSI